MVAPLPRPIRTASGDVLDAPLLLIDVLTEVWVTGRAYAFAYTPLTLRSLAQFVRDIAPELIGKSISPRADAANGDASQASRLAGIRRHGAPRNHPFRTRDDLTLLRGGQGGDPTLDALPEALEPVLGFFEYRRSFRHWQQVRAGPHGVGGRSAIANRRKNTTGP